jgi:hypothetical protein
MQRNDEPTLEQLRREASAARCRRVFFQATSEAILDRARVVAETIESRVCQLTEQARTQPLASHVPASHAGGDSTSSGLKRREPVARDGQADGDATSPMPP